MLLSQKLRLSTITWEYFINLSLPNAQISYFPNVISYGESLSLSEKLINELEWRQDIINMYGKQMLIPRLQAWYGDSCTKYQYSGIELNPLPWTSELLALRAIAEEKSNTLFNSVLANCYRNQQDSVAWHSDDEKELGYCPTIASISLGAERVFHLKHKISGELFKLPLQSGSLLIMSGETQHYWQHAVLKSRKESKSRINLTFRKIIENNFI